MNHIAIVEDDASIAEMLSFHMTSQGYQITHFADGEEARQNLMQTDYDLVLLDIMLPNCNGLDICKELRQRSPTVPILMLTSLDGEADRVIGLELGADDYVIKPAEPRVLLARINALLRRGQATNKAPEELSFGDLTIDKTSRIVTLKGSEITLTSHEFELLWLLASNAGEVLSREHVHQHMIGRQYDGLDRTVDVRVSRIRKKLGDNSDKPYRIKTVWGQGYLFVSDAWDM